MGRSGGELCAELNRGLGGCLDALATDDQIYKTAKAQNAFSLCTTSTTTTILMIIYNYNHDPISA